MSDEDSLDSKDKRNFWRCLRDPLYPEQLEIYNKNKEVFAKEDKRIMDDTAKRMAGINKKLKKIDR